MTIEELMGPLPWGLHDAYLESMFIDWSAWRLTLTARLKMSEHQELEQRARIDVLGLVFVTVSPPTGHPSASTARDVSGVWMNDGEGAIDDAARQSLPAIPDGCFLHHIYFYERWSVIHICARSAELTWLDDAPVPTRAGPRALFPGDEKPAP